MNWVGGSRSRVLIKQERRKQKEYFERNRLKSKMKLLGVLSPVKNSTVSLDLLNLYMVNQISCKKKIPETVKKPIHVNMNRDIKIPLRKHDLELPMSPNCIPSKLCLDDTESNVHYQRLGSKEELGPFQSSQDVDSYSMFEPQFNRVEDCSYTPSFSAELPSNRHITKQNFTPRISPSPQKVAYEKNQNEQLSNVNCSDSLLSKLNESQDVLSSSYKTAQFGTLSQRINSPGNRDFLTKRPAVIMDADCGSMDETRQSGFIIEKQSVQHIRGDYGKEFSAFLEDVNEPTHTFLSDNHDCLVSQNMINLLNTDQQRIKETFDKCGYSSLGDVRVVTSSDESHSTNGCFRGIFTVTESTFNNSTFNKTSYSGKCQSLSNYQKDYNSNEITDPSTSFEKDCYPTCSDKKGKLESDYQEKIQQKNAQAYPVNSIHRGNIPLEELHPKPSWDFGLGEIPVEEGGTCSLEDRPTSTKKINLDSSQSSQPTSYSPRATDSCFSSSSDMLSEDEDQILQQIEDSNKISMKTTETTNNFCSERIPKLLGDRIVKDNAKIHKQNENFHQLLIKNNTDQFPQSQCSSADIVENKTSNSCILQVARCDAGVQTEREPVMEEKLDVAIQCDIISKCTCSDVSSLFGIESCSENIKADTTGGQEILKN